MSTALRSQGTGLGIASQALFISAWAFGGLAAALKIETALSAAICGFVGLILAVIAFFRSRPALGVFGFAAGWIQLGTLGLALMMFLVIPGDREWGKLAAMVFATGVIGVGTLGAHLVAGLGLRAAGLVRSGWAVVSAEGAALGLCLLAASLMPELLLGAFVCAAVGHGALLVGFILLGRSSRSA